LLADICCANAGTHVPHTSATAKLEVRDFQKFSLIRFVTVEVIVLSCWGSIFVSSVAAGCTVFDWDFTSSVLAWTSEPAPQAARLERLGVAPREGEKSRRLFAWG
jgi:hypothetical protein